MTTQPDATQLAALGRVFSPSIYRDLAQKGESPLLGRLLNLTEPCLPIDPNMTLGGFFDTAFDVLRRGDNRNEYVYRAAITKRILLGKHSLNTAAMLSEFRAGRSKADIVVLNGVATVYEIKSERDTLARLAGQISDYQKVFAHVNLIAAESHIQKVAKDVPQEVGLLSLSPRQFISVIREAREHYDRICPATVLSSLRVSEAEKVLQNLGYVVPRVPNTQKFSVMKKMFAKLDPVELQVEMVSVVKKNRNLSGLKSLVSELPDSLHAAALSIKSTEEQRRRLREVINTPVKAVNQWS